MGDRSLPAVTKGRRKIPSRPIQPTRDTITQRLLAWYDKARRDLPWRARPGERPDPYRVWLSEIMLQQTTVGAVAPYYRKFLHRWPDIHALAAAPLEDILAAWAGLGYYSRARNLHKCARQIVAHHDGHFPRTEEALRALPGIGPYTAAAIAAIAFDAPAVVVDGNVERVVARLFAVETPLPKAKGELRRLAAGITPQTRPGDFAQAMMDLGATICRKGRPLCDGCPLSEPCMGRRLGVASALPAREKPTARPLRRGYAFVARRSDGAIFLRRRPENGLLARMMEVPGTPWEAGEFPDWKAHLPFPAQWQPVPGVVTHVFTHFRLELRVFSALISPSEVRKITLPPSQDSRWVAETDLPQEALPSLMRKVIAHALSHNEDSGSGRISAAGVFGRANSGKGSEEK